MEVEYIPTNEAAKILKTTHRGVVLGILNGTLPIGWATEKDGKYTAKVVKVRLEKWIHGEI